MRQFILILIFFIISFGQSNSSENYFEKGKKLFNLNMYEDSKFNLYKSIILNPQDVNSYIYLAKIFNFEENEIEYEKYLNIALDLDPINEEIIMLQIELRIKKSDIQRSSELIEQLEHVCETTCNKLEYYKSKVQDLSLEKN